MSRDALAGGIFVHFLIIALIANQLQAPMLAVVALVVTLIAGLLGFWIYRGK